MIYPFGYFILNPKFYENSYAGSIDLVIDPNKKINKNSLGIYIINLDRAPERYDYVRSVVEKIQIGKAQRISAVDGASLSAEQIEKILDINLYSKYNTDPLKMGTLGCYLSHIKLWQGFLESDFEYALIFEDDVSFDPKTMNRILPELISMPQQWDVVNFDSRHFGMPLAVRKIDQEHVLATYLTRVINTGAYIINRKAAQNLLKSSLPIIMPVDEYFTRSWELDIKFMGIEPRIVHQTFGDSHIKPSKVIGLRSAQSSKSFISIVRREIYLMQSAFLRFIYGVKIYIEAKFE